MEFTWPESAASWRQRARRLTEDVLRPLDGELPPAEGGLPGPLRDRCLEARRAAGLWGLAVPAAHGGAGLSWVAHAAVHEEAGGSLLGLDVHGLWSVGEVPEPLLAAGGGGLQAMLRACLQGRRQAQQIPLRAAAGLRTEPAGGGAVRASGVVRDVPAHLAGDVVLVPGADGATLVLDRDLPGYRVSVPRPSMASGAWVDLECSDCLVPAGRVLRGTGAAASRWEARRRACVVAAGALGAARRCLEAALAHARTRRTFGQPLGDRQAIQWMLADSARELHAARMLVYGAASLVDRGGDAAPAALRARILATEVACAVADRVLQIHGGYGYARDLPFERYWRDLRYDRCAEGAPAALAAEDALRLAEELDA